MIEAVGWQYFPTYFRRCSELLEPDGLMFLQAITIDDRAYEVEKASKSFINTQIFPGGCLPSLEVIHRCIAGQTDLRTVWLDDITEHYCETLRHWREHVRGERQARRASWATTCASGACGSSTSPTWRRASARRASATCRWCWPSPSAADAI